MSDPFVELENRLRARVVEPPAHLRQRVLQAVAAGQRVPVSPAGHGWRWAAVAAAAVMVMGLSMIDSARSELNGRPRHDAGSLAQLLAAESGDYQ